MVARLTAQTRAVSLGSPHPTMNTIVTAAGKRLICNIMLAFFVTLAILFKLESLLSVLLDNGLH
jgi:hypothetical protein